VVVTEFAAANASGLQDVDGDYSDWVELYNPGASAVSLEGYVLTDDADDLAKWPLPTMELGSGGFLIVFASGKDRRDPADELHTNFKLSRSGEFLGLVAPGGELSSQFGEAYPEQRRDASFGPEMVQQFHPLVLEGDGVRYYVPNSTAIDLSWLEPDYDDGFWMQGPLPLGFDRKEAPTYLDLIRTDVGEAMAEIKASLYVRLAFSMVGDPAGRVLRLRAQFEDGIVIHVNGTELTRVNGPRSRLRPTSSAVDARPESLAREFQNFILPTAGLLREGRNVIAIQVLNDSRTDPDLLLGAEVDVVEVTSILFSGAGYFDPPTPELPSHPPATGVSREVVFSVASGVYDQPFQLELEAPDAGVEIRFTRDGSLPDASSELYQGPIPVDETTALTAKAFVPGLIPSLPAVVNYVVVDPDFADFSSNLPVFVLTVPSSIGDSWVPICLNLFERGDDGRTRLGAAPTFSSPGALKLRGSSSAGRPKASYSLEIRDTSGSDEAASLLGMPEDPDWVLYGAYNFDHALLRNPFIYQLGREAAVDAGRPPGSYAVRTRFCEVYLARTGRTMGQTEYRGVYSLMEKISRGPERVDVAKLDLGATQEPEVTGGYILKIDRGDPGDTGFVAGGQTLSHVDPKEEEIERLPPQDWIRQFVNDMVASMGGPMAEDPETGFPAYIDVQAWIDHSWLNILPMNVDAYRLSTYMHKDRGGRFAMGPIWDFDRSMGSTDGRDVNPLVWKGGGNSTPYFTYPWWGLLHDNDAYVQQWERRWRELRLGVFSLENIYAIIDGMAAETAEAWVRNRERWSQGTTQDAAVKRLKSWLTRRIEWIDAQLLPSPRLSHPGGLVSPGFEVTLGFEDGIFEAMGLEPGEIYYTLNGPDPRGAEGLPAPEALRYSGEVLTIHEPVIVQARGFVESVWVDLIEATFTPATRGLVVSEIMYNPAPDPTGAVPSAGNLEFVEFQNVGDEPVELAGLRLVRPSFRFSEGRVARLQPGEFCVIVRNENSFDVRYGLVGISIAGTYRTGLSNRGQLLELVDASERPVFTVEYSDMWAPESDGDGPSLVLKDPLTAAPETWNSPEGWGSSPEPFGSPGRATGADASSGRQRIGDFTQDGSLSVSDVVLLSRHLFVTPQALPCATADGNRDLLDVDGDRLVSIVDAIHLLRYLFERGAPPAAGVGCQSVVGCADGCR